MTVPNRRIIVAHIGLTLGVLLLPNMVTAAGPSEPVGHRVVIHDGGDHGRRGVGATLKLLDLDAGIHLAEVYPGYKADIAVSADGTRLAAVGWFNVPYERAAAVRRITIYDTADLSVIHRAEEPFQGLPQFFPNAPNRRVLAFTPDKSMIIHPSTIDGGGMLWKVFAPPELAVDKDRPASEPVRAPFRGRPPVLSTARWPRVDVFDRGSGTLYSLDFETGTVSHQLDLTWNDPEA